MSRGRESQRSILWKKPSCNNAGPEAALQFPEPGSCTMPRGAAQHSCDEPRKGRDALANTQIKRIGILTGGGDCPGLNAVIRAVTKTALFDHRWECIGIEDGFLG